MLERKNWITVAPDWKGPSWNVFLLKARENFEGWIEVKLGMKGSGSRRVNYFILKLLFIEGVHLWIRSASLLGGEHRGSFLKASEMIDDATAPPPRLDSIWRNSIIFHATPPRAPFHHASLKAFLTFSIMNERPI